MATRRCAGLPGQPCRTWVATTRRCTRCAQAYERQRGTRQQRGYGAGHDRARQALAATLPAPCGYCGTIISPSDRWDAAHRVDGHPEYGYIPACPACNQQAKRPGGGGGTPQTA